MPQLPSLGVRADVHMDADRVRAEGHRLLDIADQYFRVDIGGAHRTGAQMNHQRAALEYVGREISSSSFVDDECVRSSRHQVPEQVVPSVVGRDRTVGHAVVQRDEQVPPVVRRGQPAQSE